MANHGPWILGIGASFHNGAVCLLRGNEVVVAIQEERLSRRKREAIAAGMPCLSIPYCLDFAGIQPGDLDLVVSCPILLPWNLVEQDVGLNPLLRIHAHGTPVLTIPHHLGHAIGAFATSGMTDAAVLVIDGSGSFFQYLPENERGVALRPSDTAGEHISTYHITEHSVRPLEKQLSQFDYLLQPDFSRMLPFASLGHMFSSTAAQIFGNYFDAGKVMGLAPHGSPNFPPSAFYNVKDGEFEFLDHVPERFQHADRWPLRQNEYANLAASVQRALEEALLSIVSRLRDHGASPRLCYAGGVALNSVANERIMRESGYQDVFIMPAAEDSGTAIGAAYYGLWHLTGSLRGHRQVSDAMGRSYASDQVSIALEKVPGVRTAKSMDVLEEAAARLDAGQILGWFDGGSEFGPRALGSRSILCDPRRIDGKTVLNARVKHRESFRPFAPAVLLEHAASWFKVDPNNFESPFMLRVCEFVDDKSLLVPSVVHVDRTGRVQTVDASAHPRFHQLITCFFDLTGVPMILNTSFNVMGEPIVENPSDALWSLLIMDLDCCVFPDRIVARDPGVSSLLDLYPFIVAPRVCLEIPVEGQCLQPEACANWVGVLHDERYGARRSDENGAVDLALLRLIDGRQTGRAIYCLLRENLSRTNGEKEILFRFADLRRRGIVMFSPEPRPGTGIL